MPPRTVRHLLKRFRERGEAGLSPDYRPPPTPAHANLEAIRQARPWPSGGSIRVGGPVRVALASGRPEVAWPHPRTIGRWLRRAGLGPAPSGRPPGRPGARATRPHQTWQVDACEQIDLKGQEKASWLRVVDEATGAILRTAVFPPRPLDPG